MLSSLAWVPRGVAKQKPDKYEMTEEDAERLRQAAEEEERAAAEAGEEGDAMETEAPAEPKTKKEKKAAKAAAELDAISKEFHMDDYDNEDDEGVPTFAAGLKGMMYYESNAQDPYITLPDDESEEGSDAEDFEIRPTDAVLLAARTDQEEGLSNLEVYVYEEAEENLYVHHDILCAALAWISTHPRAMPADAPPTGNYVAVGTFQPGIEIWNLDVLDVLEPSATLGGEAGAESAWQPEAAGAEEAGGEGGSGDKKKKKKKKKKANAKKAAAELKPGSHTDAVMSLSWNQHHRQVLASGSADMTVKLWDLHKQECVHTLGHHRDKVQSVAWHPAEATVLLSGSFDRTVCVLDVRSPEAVARVKVAADVEVAAWNPGRPQHLLVATEAGIVTCHDARALAGPAAFTLHAHDKAVSALSVCPAVPDLLATGSMDKTVKLWDLNEVRPSCITSKGVKEIGAVFTIGFYPDSPFLLAASGSKGKLEVWDTRLNVAVRDRFCDGRGQPLAHPNRPSGPVDPVAAARAAAAAGAAMGRKAAPEGEEGNEEMDEAGGAAAAAAAAKKKKKTKAAKGAKKP